MRNLTIAALSLGGAMIISQSVFAQNTFVENDLYLGFQNSAAAADYIVNLGSLSSILGQHSVVTVSSDFSTSDFKSVNNSSGTTLAAVVGAANTVNDAFGTVARTSNIGNPAVAGSTAPAGLNFSEDGGVYTSLSSVVGPVAGTGALDSTKSWSSAVAPTQVTGNYSSSAGFNPNSTITASSVLYEDLYLTADTSGGGRGDTAKPFIYQGYFTINFTGASPVVTFTSTNGPVTVTLANPVIVSITKAASTVTVVSTNASPTHSYQLQYTGSLNPPVTWGGVGSAVTASATRVTNTDATATGGQRFYRIQAQ